MTFFFYSTRTLSSLLLQVAAAVSFLGSTTTSIVSAQEEVQFNSCYSTTSSILFAQLQDPPVLDIVLCANTVFQIGTPVDEELTEYEDGDIPLTALHDNMTFSCGNNNSNNSTGAGTGTSSSSSSSNSSNSSNMCILQGGWIQFLTQPHHAFWPKNDPITTNNLVLEGLTFTGTLTPPSFYSSSSSPSNRHAVVINTPGVVIIEDCLFVDLDTDYVISNNPLPSTDVSLYTSFSSFVVLQGSTIQNVVYAEEAAILNYEQNLSLLQVQLDNVEYYSLDVLDGNQTESSSQVISVVNGMTDIINCIFSNITVLTSVVHVVDEAGDLDFLGIEGNERLDVQVIDTEGKDPSIYCLKGLMVETGMDGNITIDCLPLFEFGLTEPPSTAPTADQCFGICGLGGTLMNPDDLVSIGGTSPDEVLTISCLELNLGLTLLPPPYDTGACPAGARAAQLAGCQCDGVPTAAPIPPTTRPTGAPSSISVTPSVTPTVVQEEQSAAPTVTGDRSDGASNAGGARAIPKRTALATSTIAALVVWLSLYY